LIEETLLAGRVQEAFNLYWFGLGCYQNLGWILGDHARGLRILERFVPQDDFSKIEPLLPLRERSALVNDLGLFAKSLGDLSRALTAFAHSGSLDAKAADQKSGSINAQNLADVELLAGHFRHTLENAEGALALATKAEQKARTWMSLAYRATSHFALGDVSAGIADFQRATELQGEPLRSLPGIFEAERKLLLDDQSGAVSQTQASREIAVRNNFNGDVCRCNALLARLLLLDDHAQAAQHLQDARAFANRSGTIELQLRCFHAACELQRHLGDYPQSIAEGEAGILLADTCGFGKFSIDLRLALAETYLAAGDARQALQNARNALDRSEEPDCQYAWGKADGLHFCGMAHLRLGERELARQRLGAALELRERLGHGRVEETRRALEGMTG
jgi:tetratricopeptide (TPR) repeat protein